MSAYLYGQATAKIMQAERCRSVARVIDLRRAAVIERHQPVLALHREEVWMGRAASASRANLQRVIGAALYSLGLDLATASRALRSEAGSLEQEAAALRVRGRAAAEAEARAARVLAQRASS
jgi:hypothetical protein